MNSESVGPGGQLKAAREALEVSTREVADALNLPVHVIEALEADDFERLPPTVFTRGYLRSYARLLELVPEEVVASYPAPATDTEVMEQVQVADPSMEPRLARFGALALGAAALILLGIWLFGGNRGDDRPPDEKTTAAEPADQPAAAPERAALVTPAERSEPDAVEREAAVAAIGPDLVPATPDPGPGSQVGTQTPPVERADVARPPPAVAEPADPVVQPSPAVRGPGAAADEEGVRQITEFGDDLLQFSFIDECWVEVKGADGENLFSDLSRAGSTLTLRGQGPFRILLGYAPGVVLEFNGERVALSDYTRNNVATLVLGR